MSQQAHIDALLKVFEDLPEHLAEGYVAIILVPNEVLGDIAVELLSEQEQHAEVRVNKQVKTPTYVLVKKALK